MNFDAPIFIRLHRNKTELMVNVQTINSIEPFNDDVTYVYLNHCFDPLRVSDTYEEIKNKLLNVGIIL